MNYLRFAISCLLFFLATGTRTAAQWTTTGTSFFASFESMAWPAFFIVSKEAATVNFHFFNDPDSDTTFTLVPNQLTRILYADAMFSTKIADHIPGEIDNKSVFICSDGNIAVSLADYLFWSEEATALYPVEQPPITEEVYYACTPGADSTIARKAALIIAHYDSVRLRITPKENFNVHEAGVPFEITLNRGETYNICEFAVDQTGTKIEVVSTPGNHSITVLSSSDPMYVGFPWGTIFGPCCADILLEQLLPVSTWDTLYHFVPFMIAEGISDLTGVPSIPGIIRVLSSADNNNIYINGALVASLDVSVVFDTVLSEPAVITSDFPICINQFLQSSSYNGVADYSDPDQLWLNPPGSGVKESYFSAWPIYEGTGYVSTVTLVADADNEGILLNDEEITTLFELFPGDGQHKYVQLSLDTGILYHLISPEPVIGYVTTLPASWGGVTYALSDVVKVDTAISIYMCDSITLSAPGGAIGYIWSTGETTQAIMVRESGTYTVSNTYQCGIADVDTFFVTDISPDLPQLADTFICPGDTISVDVYREYIDSYLWTTGDTTPAIAIVEPGLYVVLMEMEYCDGKTDTIIVRDVPKAEIDLPADTILCEGLPVALGYPVEGFVYRWNTGSTECCIVATESGSYVLQVLNECMETAKDSMQLTVTGCDNCLLVPTAFSPNGDGLNDEFTVLSDCMMGAYRLDVYNRYGQRIFISYDPADGWDGTYNGKPADVGVYFYQVQAHHILDEGQILYKKGDITLLR